ncbi:unnamed protein product [Amaranthus hypochondriacus]
MKRSPRLFFTWMKGLLDELDALDPIATCVCNGCECQLSQKTLKNQQRNKIIQFLIKLDSRYKQRRSLLIMMKALLTISKVYGILIQEQVHLDIGKYDDLSVQEPAMAEGRKKTKFYDSRNKNSTSKSSSYIRDHCKIQGHSMEKCWKIHRFPTKSRNNTWKKEEDHVNKANANTTKTSIQGGKVSDNRFITQEQSSQLMSMLHKQSTICDVQEISHTSDSTQLTGVVLNSGGRCWGAKSQMMKVATTPYSSGRSNSKAFYLYLATIWNGPAALGINLLILC